MDQETGVLQRFSGACHNRSRHSRPPEGLSNRPSSNGVSTPLVSPEGDGKEAPRCNETPARVGLRTMKGKDVGSTGPREGSQKRTLGQVSVIDTRCRGKKKSRHEKDERKITSQPKFKEHILPHPPNLRSFQVKNVNTKHSYTQQKY